MKLLLVLVIWLGCLLPYLSSARQQLINTSIPRLPAWIAFIILQSLAAYGLSYFYTPLVTGLIILMLVMCMWIGFVLIAAHLSKRLLLVCTLTAGFFCLIFLTGITYVA